MTEENSPKEPKEPEEQKPNNPTSPTPPASGDKPAEQTLPSTPTPATPKPATPVTPAAKPVPRTPAPGQATTPRPTPPRPTTAGGQARPAARPGAVTSQSRRHFIFTWLGLAWTAFAFATGAALSTVLRFLYPNVLFEPKMSFKIGKPDEYEIGKVDLRWKDQYGVWVIRSFEGMYALSTVCTHLGCPPAWQEAEQKFKCPCHGSGFYKSGIHFEGPAPRPLERYRIVMADDGQVLIDKSKKFQQEKGEWDQPEAFLVV